MGLLVKMLETVGCQREEDGEAVVVSAKATERRLLIALIPHGIPLGDVKSGSRRDAQLKMIVSAHSLLSLLEGGQKL